MHERRSAVTTNGTGGESAAPAPAAEEHITLSQAANLAPGRPSSNCVWRWCREGVKAASGTRVRLKHVRFGSRIYTIRQWLNDFGQALAEADAAYFDRGEQAPVPDPTPARRPSKRSRRGSRSDGADEMRRRHLQAERELKEAGL